MHSPSKPSFLSHLFSSRTRIIGHCLTTCVLPVLTISFLLANAPSATAAPFEIEGVIKQVRKVETKPPYTFDDKPVVSVYVVGHRFGKDFDYQYMVVQDTTELEGITFSALEPGKYVRIKSRAEPPGMVGKPIDQIRASRYGCCNYALHMDTVRTPRNLTATITRVESFGPTDKVVTVREDRASPPEFKYLVSDEKTTLQNGTFADLAVGTTIDIAQASINVPVPQGKDHGKLQGADLYASVVTLLKGPHLMTVAGPIEADSVGMVLSHEHVLVDFIGADQAGPHRYDSSKVFETVRPHLARAHELGARLFVDCTPAFLGRDPRLLQRLGESTGLYILSNTGLYGARNGKFLPPYVANESAEQLAARWIAEARDGIEGTGIRPGFVKCGVNTNAELSSIDRKLVEAAALTHRATGLPIAVHTGAGPGLSQIELLKAHGVAPAAWIWVHAQSARDADILAAAKQGAWVSFDDLRPETMKRHLELCRLLRDQKQLAQVLLSHDAGWYDPSKPEGGPFRDYQVLFTHFLPALKEAGFTEAERQQLVTENPVRAFSVGRRLLAVDSFAQEANERQRIEQALPAKATVKPAQPRRLLIFTRNVEYKGHTPSIASACEAFARMGKKTGAFETTVSDDPAVFERTSLKQFDAVFLNNTIGNTFTNAHLRQNLQEYVTGGGGLMGVHGTSIAFMHWKWPPVEDWPEFGFMIGARGAAHPHAHERMSFKLDDAAHPLNQAFNGQGFALTGEFFRYHEPYSRHRVRVLLSMDTAKTDLSGLKPGDASLRSDGDYAMAWVKNYGRGRVFYSTIGHDPDVFSNPQLLRFYLDAAQFVLGDLPVATTPSAKLSPAVLAQEKLGWRIGIEAYTFHKFTFFETIEKTVQLGLPYIGGLSFMQQVSKGIPKNFDQNLTDDELRQIRIKMADAGVQMLTYYAQTIPNDEAGCRKLFEFGRKMGIETFMCEPKSEQLERLDKFANEYNINVAIHNHGPEISPNNWRPDQILALCEGRSKRIGAAPDLGYWLRNGIDPLEGVRLLKDRVLTLQMHDLHEAGGKGHDVPWGTGIGKSEALFRELHRLGIKPTMIGLEYAHDWFESMPKLATCIEFFNATILKLASETNPQGPQ